jgi:hypothetical protein
LFAPFRILDLAALLVASEIPREPAQEKCLDVMREVRIRDDVPTEIIQKLPDRLPCSTESIRCSCHFAPYQGGVGQGLAQEYEGTGLCSESTPTGYKGMSFHLASQEQLRHDGGHLVFVATFRHNLQPGSGIGKVFVQTVINRFPKSIHLEVSNSPHFDAWIHPLVWAPPMDNLEP